MKYYLLVFFMFIFSFECSAEQPAIRHLSDDPKLKPFLQKMLKDPRFGEDSSLRVILGSAQLHDGDGKEIFVYVSANTLCGSGDALRSFSIQRIRPIK